MRSQIRRATGSLRQGALPALLLHDLTVVAVQAVLPDEGLEARRILLAGGIAVLLQAAGPADIIVRGELEEVRVALVAAEEERMVLVTVSDRGVLAELLVRLVVRVYEVTAAAVEPRPCRLDPEMIVTLPGQFTLSAGALEYALGQGDGSGDAVLAHLLHRRLGVFVHVVTCLAHSPLYRYPVQSGGRGVVPGLQGRGGNHHSRQTLKEESSDGSHGCAPPVLCHWPCPPRRRPR